MIVKGFGCWEHVGEPVLWCFDCRVFWGHCCEPHACPPEVAARKRAELQQGSWVEVTT